MLFDLDVRLIHFPGVIGGFEMGPAALLQFWRIALDESDRSWYDRRAVLVPTSSLRDHGSSTSSEGTSVRTAE